MHRIGRTEAVQHVEGIAVQHADMVVAGFHDQRDVHGIGGEDGLSGGGVVRHHLAAGGDVVGGPDGRLGQRGLDEPDQRGDALGRQLLRKAHHLRGRPPMRDHLVQVLRARQRFGDQRGAGAAQPVLGVAGRAMLGVIRRRVRPCRQRRQRQGRRPQDFFLTQIPPPEASFRRNDARGHGFFHGRVSRSGVRDRPRPRSRHWTCSRPGPRPRGRRSVAGRGCGCCRRRRP